MSPPQADAPADAHGPVLPATAYPTFVFARLVAALTWAWSAAAKRIGPDAGWFEDALRISKQHSGIPGWSAVADGLLSNAAVVEALVLTLEVWIAVTLLLGFATRLNGAIATAWAFVVAVLAWNIPKSGEGIPESFPVPIGGWIWLLAPLVVLPFIAAATRSGRLWGLDGKVRAAWLESGSSLKQWLARHAM